VAEHLDIVEHAVDVLCDGREVGPDRAHHLGEKNDAFVGDFESADSRDHFVT